MNRSANPRMRILSALTPALFALALAGCGGGASTSENPITSPPPPAGYQGPPPASQQLWPPPTLVTIIEAPGLPRSTTPFAAS